jgi:hypothetical protein
MIQRFRNSLAAKPVSVFLLLTFLSTFVTPSSVYALTGGPSQPEVQSFTPVSTSEMVNLFTGDFVYNIPLFDVGGYPINLSYQSGITMDQQASWVGLGWNINPGSILRNMRGLPDDFSGDEVIKEQNMKPNQTYGCTVGLGAEIAGLDDLISFRVSTGLTYNNYVGFGVENSVGFNFKAGSSPQLTANLGLKTSSLSGLDINARVGLSSQIGSNQQNDVNAGLSFGSSYNARRGIADVTFSSSVSIKPSLVTSLVNTFTGKKNLGVGFGGGSTIDFAVNSYTPQIQFPQNTTSLMFSLKGGGVITIAELSADFSGFYSQQKLNSKHMEVPAYGYLYAHNGAGSDHSMMDFNREKDGTFSKNTPALPLSSFTYDVYSVSGQGVGGMYRPYRSDFGYLFDKQVSTSSTSGNLGIELGAGWLVAVGADVTINDVNSRSGKWVNDNNMISELKFTNTEGGNDVYEPYYFKQAGEMSVDPESDIFTNIQENEPVRVKLADAGWLNVVATNKFESASGSSFNLQKTKRTKRQKRNQPFQVITKGEYYNLATEKSLFSIFSAHGKDHHIAEIRITKTDGSVYNYGIPAYNTKQVEVTFNASGLPRDCQAGLVTYQSGNNSINNDRGVDGYFSKTILDDYAHSYLLTSILSINFIDIKGDGLTDDDLGTYVKFRYNKINNYKWRTPFELNSATYNEGLKTIDGFNKGDDKGSYLYGEKDVFYLDTIVTKNYIAIFHKSERSDALGVIDENGGKNDNKSLLKLDSISLFSKHEYYENPVLATPIKNVHFEYDYSQCKKLPNSRGTSNSTSGKLTLKRVYFTYGKSNKGRLSPYNFNYSNVNPDYHHNEYDRWGYYKEENPNPGCGYNDNLTNMEYPYTSQDASNTNKWVAAWEIESIRLPSGGTIKVNYESDDYAYVQDKEATQMFKISGIGTDESKFDESHPINSTGVKIFFELQDPIDNNVANGADALFEKYLKNLDWIYFRTLAHVNQSSKNNGYEYVSGYAKLGDSMGLCNNHSNQYHHGWIKLKSIEDFHPISQAAVQFARIYTSKEAFNYTANDGGGIENIIQFLADGGFVSGAIEAFMGSDKYLYNVKHLGRNIKTDKSWIKLRSPNQRKLGGGSRVKQLAIIDNWNDMTISNDYKNVEYVQEFDYSMINDNGDTISSGVAAYEPAIGGDENPLKSPVFHGNDKALLAPDNRFFMEEPFGETFFPAPIVGYSSVKVSSYTPESITRHASGYVLNEFYTAKDYPVITKRTEPDDQERKSGFLASLLSMKVKHYMTASQGYSIVLNDMHGKPKTVKVFAEGKESPISGVAYYYKDNGTKVNGNRIQGNRLVNKSNVITKEGEIETAMVGVDYDFITDFRQQQTEALNIGAAFDLYTFTIFIVPIVIPTVWPTLNTEDTRFRSASTTKVINQYGLLDETVAWDQSSIISTNVVALDAETGESLLTQTINEFNDNEFNMKYPAHWAYKKMGMAYGRIGLIEDSVNVSSIGLIKNTSLSDGSYLIQPGDELALYENGTSNFVSKAWAWDDNTYYKWIFLIDENGDKIQAGEYELKIIKPAHKNMLEASVGSLVTKTSPLDNLVDDKIKITAQHGILNASAVEYDDSWGTFCDCNLGAYGDGNPFLTGQLGMHRPKKAYYYPTDRTTTQSVIGEKPIRIDGVYTDFKPMWKPPTTAGTPWIQQPDDWRYKTTTLEFSPYGPGIEDLSYIGVYSSALFGYNHSLPIAVAGNAKQREIAFDGFEDYDMEKCADGHFNFFEFNSKVTRIKSHSGRHAIKLSPEDRISVTRSFNGCNN